MASCISKLLGLCERHFFMVPVLSTGTCERPVESFKFGPAGELLKNNIHQEWLYSNVISMEENIFPYSSVEKRTENIVADLITPFEYIHHLSSGQLPFGLAECRPECDSKICEVSDKSSTSKYFNPKQKTLLRMCMFESPANSIEFFDYWQWERKKWWRKFSACPGRFSLTDTQNVEGRQVVNIQAEFSWGCQTVETVTLHSTNVSEHLSNSDKKLFEAKVKSKKVIPHIIESTTSLESAVFTYLCDAFDEPLFLGLPREVMRFHRKLAPFKASFAASTKSSSAGRELGELALYLMKQFRKSKISTLLLPDVARRSLEAQFARNDQMGIPYTVVMNDSTLKTGIIGLRCRQTTLKEQVHVSKLTDHMELLLKNY